MTAIWFVFILNERSIRFQYVIQVNQEEDSYSRMCRIVDMTAHSVFINFDY